MLVRIDLPPFWTIVDPEHRPRYWATAWTLNSEVCRLAENSIKQRLRDLDHFYNFLDRQFGFGSLDAAISDELPSRLQSHVESYYADLSSKLAGGHARQRTWGSVQRFVVHLALSRSVNSSAWVQLLGLVTNMPPLLVMRPAKIAFARALPDVALRDFLDVAHPRSSRNPYQSESSRHRNWLLINLLLLAGLRRGEALLLVVDSLKRDIDQVSGKWVCWLNVTRSSKEDHRTTKPSMKSLSAHRQVPISLQLAELVDEYVHRFRASSDSPYLLTSKNGAELSAESVTRIFSNLSQAISVGAMELWSSRSGDRATISAHDLRHTCATARFSLFLAAGNGNRDLALQRMRAFFGWTPESPMPNHYARAAIQDDLMRNWNDLFENKINILRSK